VSMRRVTGMSLLPASSRATRRVPNQLPTSLASGVSLRASTPVREVTDYLCVHSTPRHAQNA
jgi:hypothetical protein